MARHPAPTFVFADLVGYTSLTEQRGDDAAARVAHDFWRAMSALCREHGARQVKAMGDGAMIWAPDAGRAVTLAASAVHELGTRDDLLPVRVGVHTGPAVMRGGDWYGGAVNLAARLAAAAEPNQALVSGATRPPPRRDATGRPAAAASLRWPGSTAANRGLGADRQRGQPPASRGTLRWKDHRLARVLIESDRQIGRLMTWGQDG